MTRPRPDDTRLDSVLLIHRVEKLYSERNGRESRSNRGAIIVAAIISTILPGLIPLTVLTPARGAERFVNDSRTRIVIV